MKQTLDTQIIQTLLTPLEQANHAFSTHYPGHYKGRQPVHTMYGGAQLFKSDLAPKMGKLAIKVLEDYAPNFAMFARAVGLSYAQYLPDTLSQITAFEHLMEESPEMVRRNNAPVWLAYTIYSRVIDKLRKEAVEDFRIDFEDGYGNRSDAEEDGHAASTAMEVAKGMEQGTLAPFIGIRVKPLTEELSRRSIRTLDIFISTLLEHSNGQLPNHFVITLPKVTIPEQVTAFVGILNALESQTTLPSGSLKMELMVETTQSLIDYQGRLLLPLLVNASQGRCIGAHFGTYDYTASCNITAKHQHMTHASCDFARHIMQISLGDTGIMLSDGATNIMPVPPHRGESLNSAQISENIQGVHKAWQLHFEHVQHSLIHGYYQGWDLHPNQLPTRYAALYDFFLKELVENTLRLKTFVEKAAQATLVGDVFDDAATGQGLLNYFRRGLGCGAITEDEVLAAGITPGDLRGTSQGSPWLKYGSS